MSLIQRMSGRSSGKRRSTGRFPAAQHGSGPRGDPSPAPAPSREETVFEVTAEAKPELPTVANLVHIVSAPVSFLFLRGQLRYMKSRGFHVEAISSPGPYREEFGGEEGILTHAVDMPRRISPWTDAKAIYRLTTLLRRIRPTILQSHTPKGGFLGMIAGFLAGVPVRLYTLHGLRLATTTGLRRRLLWCTEKLSCLLAHRVIAVGPSLRRAAMAAGLASKTKIKVLGRGTINGVDASGGFDPRALSPSRRNEVRRAWGIPADARVIGFVGRLVKDKGLEELVGAWSVLREEFADLRLLLVGPFESGDPLPAEAARALRSDPRVHLAGEIREVRDAYSAMDVVALPTYREGFPLVPLEAAAMELPIVVTRVTGCVDAVEDGKTGTIVPPKDAASLEKALRAYLEDPSLRRGHGRAARERVLAEFKPEVVWKNFRTEYEDLLRLKRKASPPPAATGRGVRAGGIRNPRPIDALFKRLLDIGAAAAGLVLLAPVMAILALAIRWGMGRPILFRQRRPGLGGKPYTLLKFRTMVAGDLPDDRRTTRLGAFLRATSLDELPQLWNVLRGEMSLVGPRPLLMQYLGHYSPEQARRHEVKPGVTGWTQIRGRNSISWDEKFRLDLWYVDHWSLGLDLKILLLTVGRVMSRSGVNGPGNAAMPEFMKGAGFGK